MSVRQYIGARYVPRFLGTYDGTQQYDALDVVDNGSGTSYIAIKTVPPGTPLTDREFWAVYGAASGAIINLQQQIDDMKDITESGSLQNQIGDLSALDTSAQNDLVSAINEVDDKLNKKYIIIADSYGTGFTNGGTITPNMMDLIKTDMGLTEGVDVFTHASNGSGFSVSGSGNMTFLQQLQAITVTDPDKITDIIVLGGWNDQLSTGAAIETAIAAFVSYAKTTYPNAKVRIGMISNGYNRTARRTIQTVVFPAYLTCGKYGAAYLTGVENIMHDYRNLSSDGVHPGSAGVAALASGITSAILNGSVCSYSDIAQLTCTLDNTNIGAGGIMEMASRLCNDSVFFTMHFELPLNTPIPIPNGLSSVVFGTFKGGHFGGLIGGDVTTPCIIKNTSGTFFNGLAKIGFTTPGGSYDTEVTANISIISIDGTGYSPGPIDLIRVPALTSSFPTAHT